MQHVFIIKTPHQRELQKIASNHSSDMILQISKRDLKRETGAISALSSRNVGKYEFLTSKDVLPKKDFLEKAATIKRFEYSPLGKGLKAQTDIAKNNIKY